MNNMNMSLSNSNSFNDYFNFVRKLLHSPYYLLAIPNRKFMKKKNHRVDLSFKINQSKYLSVLIRMFYQIAN